MQSRDNNGRRMRAIAIVELEERAAAEFADLSAAEKILLRAAARGQVADCAGDAEDASEGRNRSAWGEARTIRAALLRWLCVDQGAVECVDLRGIAIASARISGKLDLAYATLHFPLSIARCTIAEGIDLTHAESRLIALDGSSCGPIDAHGIAVRGGISLSGVRTLGAVDLSGAVVSDSVDCGQAHLLHRGATAFDAEHSNIGGSLLFNHGFRAFGLVNLRGAAIGDNLDCSGGVFHNRNRVALLGDGLKVGGNAIFDDGFRTDGTVTMRRATVGTDVSFQHAAFNADQSGGADLSRAVVDGRLVWNAIEKNPRTRLDLSDAQFEQLADDAASWPAAENFAVEGCRYGSIASGFAQLPQRLRMLRAVTPFSPQAYTELADALRRQGREHEAMEVVIERERLRYQHEKMSFVGRAARRLLGVATGYGYKAYRVMLVPVFLYSRDGCYSRSDTAKEWSCPPLRRSTISFSKPATCPLPTLHSIPWFIRWIPSCR